MGFEVRGFDELKRDFAEVVKEFPYEAERRLQTMGTRFRKSVISKTPTSSKKHKKKLAKSFKLSKPKGYGQEIKIEFWSNAPHFHLIERGHAKVTKKGKVVGRVPGRHMVERTTQEFEREMPVEAEKLVRKLIGKIEK